MVRGNGSPAVAEVVVWGAPPARSTHHDPDELPTGRTYNPLRHLSVARVVSLLEASEQGYLADLTWLYRFVEKREAVTSALKMRRMAALGAAQYAVELEPEAEEDPAKKSEAEAQREALKRAFGNIDNMTEAWCWLGMATFRGYAHLEKVYDHRGMIRHLEPVPQWFWCQPFPRAEWQYNAKAANTNRGEPVDESDYLVREVETSIDELAALKFVPKTTSLKDWALLCAKFGIPNVFMQFSKDSGATPQDYASARAMLERYVSNGQGALPPGVEVKLFGAAGSSDGTPFPGLLGYLDTELVLRGTGGKLTMLSEATGIGAGATDAHQDVFAEIAAAELVEIATLMQRSIGEPVLNRIFPGRPHLARLVIRRKDRVDDKAGAEILSLLRGAGYRPKLEDAERLVGMELEEVDPVGTTPESNQPIPGYAMNRVGDEIQGEATQDPTMLRLQRAVGADTADALKQFAAAFLISDEAKREAKLKELLASLPEMLAKANLNGALADEFEQILAEAFAEGIAEET